MSDVTLRRASADDEPFLRALFRTTRESLLQAMPLAEAQRAVLCDMQFRAQAAGYRDAHPGADYFVVCDAAAEPIGRLTRASRDDALVLVEIALVPQARGHGIGTSLVRALQSEARSRGIALELSVESTNPALRLYRRLGFAASAHDGIRYSMRWQSKAAFNAQEEEWTLSSEK